MKNINLVISWDNGPDTLRMLDSDSFEEIMKHGKQIIESGARSVSFENDACWVLIKRLARAGQEIKGGWK